MNLIKKIILSLFLVFFLPSVLIADVVDDELPADTPAQVKEQARQVIRLGVENHGVIEMTKTMLQNRFTEQQMIKACEMVAEAKKNGIPEEPLMNKLHEGVGKRVKSENIIMAMEKVQERYQTANKYANQISGDKEQAGVLTGHIAECMSAGMSDDSVGRISRMLGSSNNKNNRERSSLEVQTFVTAKTMARLGANSASVVDAVDTALRNGYDQHKMSQLEKAFVTQARARYNPTSIAESFSRGINGGMPVDDLGRRSYMNSNNVMSGNSYGNGAGSGIGNGQGGAGGSIGGSAGSAGSAGAGGSMGGSGSSGSGRGSGGGGGRGR